MNRSVLLCVFTLWMGAVQTGAPSDSLVARSDSLSLTRAELGDWLVDKAGLDYVREYMLQALVMEAAEKRGMAPTDEQVRLAWEAERDVLVRQYHKGQLARFENTLTQRGEDPERHAARRMQTLRGELAREALARADRTITPEAMRKRFGEIYGESGSKMSLDVLFFDMYRDVPEGGRPDMGAMRDESLMRAAAALEALQAGESFTDLRAASDKVNSGFVDENGHIDLYRKGLLGKIVHKEVELLSRPGQLTPAIQVFDGFYVIRLATIETVKFEDVTAELFELMTKAAPNASALGNVETQLETAHGAEVLLR
jgi:hypothetical protein